MVQGKIVRPAPRMMDREALQHLAEQQQKAIDAVTADLYDAHIMTNRPLPKAMDFSWCLTTSREPEAVEPPMSSSDNSASPAALPKGHPQISPATVQKPTHSMVCWMNFGNDFYERMKVARSTAAKHGLALQSPADASKQMEKEEEKQKKRLTGSSSSSSSSSNTAESDSPPPHEAKQHGGFFDGRFVFSLRGSENYITRAGRWRDLPPELFVLLGETGYSKVRIQKEVSVKDGKSTITLNRFVLVSLGEVVDNTRARFKAHLHRIYSPGWNNLMRLPEFFQAGTPWQFAKRTVDIVKEGKPLELAQRMLESTGRVVHAYAERQRSERNGGGNGNGGGPPSSGGGSLGPPGGGGGEAV